MPKLVDHEGRREAVVRAASRRIGRVGLDAVTMRDIATEAGCTTGMITHYFESKEDVLLSALVVLTKEIFDRLDSCVISDLDSFIDALEVTLPVDEDRLITSRVWVCFWGRAFGSEELMEHHRQFYDSWHRFLVGALEALRGNGLPLPDVHLAVLARHVMAAVDGINVQATLDPSAWPAARQRQTIDGHVRLLLQLS
jgi:TetR/AcrR family transcriptional repressor of bet genes